VLIRLAERARATELERGERRTTDDTVWVVASGAMAIAVREGGVDQTASIVRKRGAGAGPGNALGMIRVVRPATPTIELVAEQPSVVIGLAVDDVRDILEEDPAALAALADRLAALLLAEASS
jgi:CRP-like cAMP-binding protein